MSDEKTAKSWMDSGEWAGMTMGEFISLLVDGGNTDSVFVRITGKTPTNTEGNYQQYLEVHLVPNGEVLQHAEAIGCKKFDTRRLIPAIERGLVK